jgi:hypothetical protein
MFAEIRDDLTDSVACKVTALGFRNLSIYVVDNTGANNTINVGAVAGKYAGASVMQNITVHGTISVKSKAGTVNVGGVFGYDETGYTDGGVSAVLERAIVVATIRAEGNVAVAGGIIGAMSQHNTSIAGVVSLSEVYAKGNTTYAGGFVGRYKGLDGNNYIDWKAGTDYTPASADSNATAVESAFMDAVFAISSENAYTKVATYGTAYKNKYVKTYDQLYAGSKTAFDGDSKYTTPVTVKNYGIYDVVAEKDVFAGVNTTGTMRLKDIVDIYVLGYGLTRTTATVNGASIDTFKKEATSKYFHASGVTESPAYKPDGTSSNPIKIAYQQHLSLIRMFNYMHFELSKDIKMYTGYELPVVDEAFTGTIQSNGHTVNVRSAELTAPDEDKVAVWFVYQPLAFDWLIID